MGMGSLFKFGQAVPAIFKFLYLEKLAFFRILGGDYEGHLKTGMVLKRLFSCFVVELQLKN